MQLMASSDIESEHDCDHDCDDDVRQSFDQRMSDVCSENSVSFLAPGFELKTVQEMFSAAVRSGLTKGRPPFSEKRALASFMAAYKEFYGALESALKPEPAAPRKAAAKGTGKGKGKAKAAPKAYGFRLFCSVPGGGGVQARAPLWTHIGENPGEEIDETQEFWNSLAEWYNKLNGTTGLPAGDLEPNATWKEVKDKKVFTELIEIFKEELESGEAEMVEKKKGKKAAAAPAKRTIRMRGAAAAASASVPPPPAPKNKKRLAAPVVEIEDGEIVEDEEPMLVDEDEAELTF